MPPIIRHKTLLFFLSLLSLRTARALPSTTLIQQIPASPNATVKDIIPFCFSQQTHPGMGPTNPTDCNRALARLIREPGFAIPLRFSKNPRRLDTVRIPQGWGAGECVIFVSCENTLDADIFRYADIARAARNTIERCVDVIDPRSPDQKSYGGLEGVGKVGTFYVSVGSPQAPQGFAVLSSARNAAAG